MKKIALITAIAGFAFNGAVNAASVTGNANVNIISALSIVETTNIDFGSIANVDGTCNMDNSGSLSGGADMNCTGTATPALFTLSGAASEAVDIGVTADPAVDGVTYNPVFSGGSTVFLDGSGAAAVTVHGSVSLSSATTGDKDIAYTFTANYQW